MKHDFYLPCLNAPIDFLPFSITISFHLKAHLRSCTRAAPTGSYASSSSLLFLSTLQSLSLSVARFKLVVASLNTFWSNQLCFTVVASSYSNSRQLRSGDCY
ncbi:unnamed protein product [Hymenolepis diminuta]|uniref:Uncharacterized protein n=1 Tax=Hymenolepis diminuta TaxID=6216 RepID=A0A564ZCJ0_HYMDI|nr:unnamed protein product [Hymenolepis diminuta]